MLHNLEVSHVKSTFPVSLGARITGVDDKTYSSTGESFSAILLPNSESNATKRLQADDVSLAYEFSKKVTYRATERPCFYDQSTGLKFTDLCLPGWSHSSRATLVKIWRTRACTVRPTLR